MIAVLFHRLGPYHHARLKSLARHFALQAIEYSSVDATYAWDAVDSGGGYPVVTAFPEADIDAQPADLIKLRVHEILDRIGPRLVAIPGWSSPASLAALEWCCLHQVPSVLMSDSTEYDESRVRWKEWIKKRIVALYSSALVAGKPHVDYVEVLGMPRKSVTTGYDVVDNEHFEMASGKVRSDAKNTRRKYGLPEQYFLASNRFVDKKNLFRLLDAYAQYVSSLGNEAWDLVLLGDGPLAAPLRAQVARLDLTSRVHFPGFKQYAELPVFYALAETFIHASTTEQWGLVVNEAMACGLPVLVSNRCGCTPNLVNEGINGFTFDPYNVEDIAKLMIQISSENCDRAALGLASRKIIDNWSPDTFSEGMMRAADTALSAPRPRMGFLDRLLLQALMRR